MEVFRDYWSLIIAAASFVANYAVCKYRVDECYRKLETQSLLASKIETQLAQIQTDLAWLKEKSK